MMIFVPVMLLDNDDGSMTMTMMFSMTNNDLYAQQIVDAVVVVACLLYHSLY